MTSCLAWERAKLDLKVWHEQNLGAPRLSRHEACKALLFWHGRETAVLEPIIQVGGRRLRIDYIDSGWAVEIDDGPNEKSCRKLAAARQGGRSPLWVLLLSRGHGGRAVEQARRYDIPLVRVLCRNNFWEVVE